MSTHGPDAGPSTAGDFQPSSRLMTRAHTPQTTPQAATEFHQRLGEVEERLDLLRRLDAILQSERDESAILSKVAQELAATHGLSARTVRVESNPDRSPGFPTPLPSDGHDSPLVLPVHCGGSIFAELWIDGGPWNASWLECWLPILGSCASQIGLAIQRIRVELENDRIRDELRRARDEAVAANRVKSVFLTNMSHELRTPLHTIIGYSELLIEESAALPPPQIASDLRKVLTAGVHLLHLINDILDLSRIEDGKMQLTLKSFEVYPLIQDVVASVRPLAEERKNDLFVHCLPSMGSIVSDEQKLRQILANLLTNAAKFTENGTIGIFVDSTVRNDVGYLVVSITDTGVGIPEAKLTQLFQPFMQGDSSSTRRFGGNGVGLAISRRLCQMLGGEIQVNSTPGTGSVFSLLLPGIEAARPITPRPETPTPSARRTEPWQPTLLALVETPNARERLTSTLASEGFRIITPEAGENALSVARSTRPDLIAIEVSDPTSKGWQAVADVKSDPNLGHIPVILTVIHSDHQPDVALGATDCFIKPVDWERFEAAVARKTRGAARKSILVVDDDADASEIVRRLLELDGWSVQTASNGREALEVLQKDTPALIVVDLVMPVMDGFSLMEHLQASAELRDIPTLVVSAISLEPEEHLRLNARITAPPSHEDPLEDLMSTVHRVLGQRPGAASA